MINEFAYYPLLISIIALFATLFIISYNQWLGFNRIRKSEELFLIAQSSLDQLDRKINQFAKIDNSFELSKILIELNTFVDLLRKAFECKLHGNCSVSIQIFSYPPSMNTSKVLNEANLKKLKYHTISRSYSPTHDFSYIDKPLNVSDNTDLSYIVNNNLSHFIDNNIPNSKYFQSELYSNTNCPLPYKSLIVVPILNKYLTHTDAERWNEMGEFKISGFLSIDSVKTNAFDEKLDVVKAKTFASGLFDTIAFLIRYNSNK